MYLDIMFVLSLCHNEGRNHDELGLVLHKLLLYTASKNYMQIGLFLILYPFLNQGFGNLARGIVTFVPVYVRNFMLISAIVNKW